MNLSERREAEAAADRTGSGHRPDPCVTVIVPVYNRVRFLPQAIQSVLGQSHGNIQTIVVDDGSPLDMKQAVAPFGEAVELYRKPQGGPASARNFGIKRARGEFLLFLDDDDFLEPTAVASLVAALRDNPDLAWAAGRLAYVDENCRKLPLAHRHRLQSGDVYAEMIQNNLIGAPSTVLVRREVVCGLGGFDESPAYQLCEDYDLWLALAHDFPITALPEVVANYRYHATNATRQWACFYRAWLAVLEKNRARARPGFDPIFQQATARVHLNFGDELYVHGRHAEARQQWGLAYKADHQLGRSLLWRCAKSYVPPGLLDTLRGAQRRLLGFPHPDPRGERNC